MIISRMCRKSLDDIEHPFMKNTHSKLEIEMVLIW